MTTAIGIDFGTTNSSIARASCSGEISLAQFPFMGEMTDAYRSLLYVEQVREHQRKTIKAWTGPPGIEHYLAAETKGRLIQSLKSFLTSRNFHDTNIFGTRHTLEDLIARILRDLREKAESQFQIDIKTAIVGRPVHFVGGQSDDDDSYAEDRLKTAFRIAGYESIRFEMEPVAAAHFYESTLDHDELILIGDFGGGTSDFSLLHVGPTIRHRGRTPSDLLGNAGIGIAGDAFDAKIVRNLVSPALGAGTQIRSVTQLLPIPIWVYAKLERWHHLSFLKAPDVMNMLQGIQKHAIEPRKIAALIHLIKDDRGYDLHHSVQRVKSDLSQDTVAQFYYSDGVVDLKERVERSSFESWISDELMQIESCVESLLTSTAVSPKDVDKVFLTGGSSFVPAVRKIFEGRFGAQRISSGYEFTSVARGLALKAIEHTA